MFVVRVIGLQRFEQHRIEVLPVRQLTLVELLQRPALNLPGHKVVGRKHHVVTGFTGHQLAVEGFVAVVDVIGDPHARLFFEVLGGVRRNVVGPVVNLDRFRCLSKGNSKHQRCQSEGLADHGSIPVWVFFFVGRQSKDQTIRKSARSSCARFPGYPRHRACWPATSVRRHLVCAGFRRHRRG
ncbi:hypothetical protein D3C85_135600 [compost metagenome]